MEVRAAVMLDTSIRRQLFTDLVDLLPLPWDTEDVVFQKDGHVVVSLVTWHDWQLEGFLLNHCLGTKDYEGFRMGHRVFSVRDPHGIPHATILYTTNRDLSPYGDCCDFGDSTLGIWKARGIHLLQVRGRNDRIARVEYHRIAREFHKKIRGKINYPDRILDEVCQKYGDHDSTYHYAYRMHHRNDHNPGFWKEAHGT